MNTKNICINTPYILVNKSAISPHKHIRYCHSIPTSIKPNTKSRQKITIHATERERERERETDRQTERERERERETETERERERDRESDRERERERECIGYIVRTHSASVKIVDNTPH